MHSKWLKRKMTVNNGVQEISLKSFEQVVNKHLVVVDFFAEWCMPCLMMAPIVEELADKFKGKINFAKINIDDNSSLSEKYKVMSIPTIIMFKDGKEVARIIGTVSGEQLEEKLNSLLD